MKKLFLIAALLMATTTAHAGNSLSFEINGHKVHLAVPDHCDQLSCIEVSAPGLSGSDFGFKSNKSKHSDDDVAKRADPPEQTPASPPAAQTAATEPAAAQPNNNPPVPTAVATAAPTPAATDTVAPPAPAQAAQKPAAVAAPAEAQTTPVGTWNTEENKGLVRIESCGQNLCGYTVKGGERVLIDMKPSDAKWTGRIHDPDSDRTYDANIAMKGPNALRVQGCAFGGLFCGSQTWKRVG
jgi:hypothetical protein